MAAIPQIPAGRSRSTLFAGLRVRLLALALCCLLPAVGVVCYVGLAMHQFERSEARNGAQRLTSLISAGQNHMVDASRQLLLRLASEPRVHGTYQGCSKYLAEVLRMNPTYANLGMAAPNGDVVASAIPLPRPVHDADRSWFRRAIDPGDFAYGSYEPGRVVGKPVVNFAYPVFTPSEKLEGVLFASVDVSWFENMEYGGEVPAGSILAILDDAGNILASHPGNSGWAKSPEARMRLGQILRNHGGTLESAMLDGTPRLWSFSPLFSASTPGGYVAIGIPDGSVFAESNHAAAWTLIAVLFITGLGALGAWIGSDVLVMRKVGKLIETSRMLAAGDLGARSGLSQDAGELGQLGQVMDDMAASLSLREQEVRAAERSLGKNEKHMAAQHGVARTLADSESMSKAAPEVLHSFCRAFGWDAGFLWMADPDAGVLRCVGAWSSPGIQADDLVNASVRMTLARGESGPGRIWATGDPYCAGRFDADGAVGRTEAAAAAGLRSTLAFPIPGGPEMVGVLESFSKSEAEDQVPVEAVSVLTRQIGQYVVRRRAERTQAQLLGILETTSDLVGFATPEGRVLYTNPAGRKMLGVGQNEEMTQIADYYDAPNGKLMAEIAIPTAMKDGVWVGEVTMRRRDGQPVRVSQAVMVHRAGNGEVEYTSTIGRDITEKVKLEEQLRQAQKMEAIGSLAGGIAHDFNNLLTAIQGFSDLALTRLDNPEILKRDIEEIRRAGVRAAALTRQLLIFSRQQVLEPRLLDVNLLVTELGKMLRRLIGEDIELTISCGEPAAIILADPGQIEQVIINLVVNARDAMPEGGQLFVETSPIEIDGSYAAIRPGLKPGSYVMLAVSDNGTGMDAATQARIFEPFFTTKEPGKGTGLGLATVYGIVKQCEGDVHLYSEPGEGTTFKILLPRSGARADLKPADGAGERSRGGSETILVVEDEEAVRSLIRSSLSLRGYTVIEASDGAEALAVQATVKGPIHLAICDMVMPLMNGPEVAARLGYLRPDTKVLFISGYAEKSVLRRGLSQGAAFLHKPFGLDALAIKVREVLDGVAAAPSVEPGPAKR